MKLYNNHCLPSTLEACLHQENQPKRVEENRRETTDREESKNESASSMVITDQ